ncbi:hypothetical protein CRUP_018441 [Coryphaenoides rupestris]|nr:hypothetical protein CRUP_018441 [Coryphaenoides rupestris]
MPHAHVPCLSPLSVSLHVSPASSPASPASSSSSSSSDTVCNVEEFRCHDGHTCVPDAWLCDGDADCPDASDETASSHQEEFAFRAF